ncbi:MAG TPA: glycosyltransferase family 4 protein [Fimbriimonas sp.]
MKVLQVASSLHDWGGIERYVHYLANGLTARGHEVLVACPPGSPLDRKLEVPKIPITMRGKYNPLSALPYLLLFRQRRFDVVHIHFSPDFQMPAWAAKRTRQGFVVMTRHVSLPWPAKKVRAYTRLFDHFIPVSDSVRRRLEESGIPPDRMTVAKAGVPALEPTRPVDEIRREFGFSGFVVGSFGRLVPEKGTRVLVDAAEACKAPMTVAVFGDGPERKALQESAGANVRFFGQIESVANAMSAVDVVAIPSVWEEAFPYSALEAMSLGRPIIGANVGGMPEMLEPGRNGFLFERGSFVDLAAKIDRLAADPALRESMGDEGRSLHRREYTVARMAERIEAVYRSG